MTTGTLALAIAVIILVQIATVMLIGLYRRKRQYRNLDVASSKSQSNTLAKRSVSTDSTELGAPGLAWEGFREFLVHHRSFEDVDQSICSFYLVPVDGKPLPSFKPGQFLTFKLSIENRTTHEPRTVVRCYSLSDRPSPAHYRISVKRVPPPADQPNLAPGLSSNFFHDQVQEGSRLLVKMPAGHFHLMEDKPLPVVLIAGGIGITPMLSILNALMENGSTREVWLFYGIRNSSEQVMKEHLLSLAETHANFHLHLCFSNPHDNEVEGIDYRHKGRVDIPLLRATLKLMRHQFYVCGPKPMMESLVPGLEEWGVDRNDIYYESFGPATLIRQEKTNTAVEGFPAQPLTITFSKSDKQISWSPEAESLLEFAEAKGIEVESGCRAGSCGSCLTLLEAGEVEYSQQPDADVESGHCLLCISKPKSDLTLVA